MKTLILHLSILIAFPFMLFGEAKELRFHYLSTENGLSRNTGFSVVEDRYGFIWIATIDGLCRFDGYQVKQFNMDAGNPRSIFSNRPKRLIKDSQGNIWISFTALDPVCRYNYQTDDFTRFDKKDLPQNIRTLLANSDLSNYKVENSGYRWETKNGLLCQTNKKTLQQLIYRFNPKNEYGLKDELITGLCLDSRNILWVATDVGGVCYADVNQSVFKSCFFADKASKSISETAIRAICQTNDGNLWISTRLNGAALINKLDNSRINFRHDPKDPNSLSDDRVRKIYKDKYGQLWFGTKGGVDRFLPESNRFKHYPAIGNKQSDNWVFAIEEDRRGDLWVGTWQSGIARYDKVKDKFIPYRAANPNDTWNIRAMLREGESDLWIGSEGNGLTLLKRRIAGGKERCSFSRFVHQAQDEHSLSDNRVYSLCKDRDGFLWIGTGRGLNRFDPRTGRFIRFPDKRFISNGMIFGILNDNAGDLWVSHPYGLTRINSRTFRTSDYNTHNDLFDNAFTEDAYYQNPETGECFFGGNLGITSFNPATIKDNATPPRVVVTDFRISGKSVSINQKLNGRIVLVRPAYLTKSVTLNWEDRNLELEFAALHFTNPVNNTYAYRLSGFEKEWKNTDASARVASYTNLPAGKYLFEVKAASSNGIWTVTPSMMEIIILPPWWRTWWAYLFYSLIIAGIIYLAFKIIITREKLNHQIQIERLKAEKAEQMEEVARIRTNFFTNISHELRTPLTLILDPINRMIAGSNDQRENYLKEVIKRNAERLLTLVNELLDVRKAEEGRLTLNWQPVDLIFLINDVRSAFLYNSGLRHITINFVTELTQLPIQMDRERMETVLYNLLSNAVKNSDEQTSIAITLNLKGKDPAVKHHSAIEICIQNQGKTIEPSDLDKIFDPFYQASAGTHSGASGTGLGLTITKQIVELHGGSISASSTNGITTFRIFMPYIYADNESVAENTNQTGIYLEKDEALEANFSPKDIAAQANLSDRELPLILLIEDNEDIRGYIKSELRWQFNIQEAANGEAGVEIAQTDIPDLIITDVMMPGISGFEVCTRIKNDMRTCHIPVILLTARQSEESYIEGYETGADSYITKPFSIQVLESRMLNLLNNRQKLASVYQIMPKPDVIENEKTENSFIEELKSKLLYSEGNYNVEILAENMHMSRSQLYRKIKALTNQSASDFIAEVRMEYACRLLVEGEYNISEIALKLGYSELANFSRSFYRRFGKYPTQYLSNKE